MKLIHLRNRGIVSLAVIFIASLFLSYTAFCVETEVKAKKTEKSEVIIETSMGDIKVELNMEKASVTVENFLKYVDEKFFDGTIFHRVINDFMIQGGGFTEAMVQKKTHDPIKNEAGNGLKNSRGTIAMARTNIVDSATSQFFINVKDNAFLDHRTEDPSGFGYAVFGRVVDGMDTVDKIKAVKTGMKNGMGDVPLENVIIKSIKRVAESGNKTK
jgi:cyclophilin family peptidyl-prolyl cis-trans isomerase